MLVKLSFNMKVSKWGINLIKGKTMLKENAETSTNLGETRDVGKISAEKLFEKKKEQIELIYIAKPL